MALSALKKNLREEYLLKRSLMPLYDAVKFSQLIEDYLLSLPEFLSAGSVALYAGVQGEVLTDRILLAALTQGKEVYYPKSDVDSLHFYKVEAKGDLSPGRYSIPEPSGEGRRVELKELDLIIVPGIAFDRTGSRLGFGKGYYDKELTGVSSPKIALAFHMQVTRDVLPVEKHDVRMDILITERGVERF
ncbi:MAG: 5-formyltetrahydrofolate cyclo-ligase [Proteobacteria bacterium]|nr:5-formyltetrahydrofolate cyclo-ligase [Pseudomonadota bacterium]